MGTNYYISKGLCPCCGRGEDKLHIGKSPCGWHFSLHVIPEQEINSLEDWKKYWNDHPSETITNEYGDELSREEMLGIITDRRCLKKIKQSIEWYETNQCEPGLNNLVRSRIDGRHCVGHGDGTWDYITGEFS